MAASVTPLIEELDLSVISVGAEEEMHIMYLDENRNELDKVCQSTPKGVQQLIGTIDPDATKRKILLCALCEFNTTHKNSLTRHMSRKHTSIYDVFECDQCGKIYKSKDTLNDHVRGYHNGEFKCSQCFK
ncbi:unnamed protein product [Owenia fusiformis]|uniref:Uncharacterized protein n=1 Tax=Owenia fusiformis TaxID=6347 RepID=A0A8J1T582_OWEFU|nr:unnamed protein product [Owenia fusiformis]